MNKFVILEGIKEGNRFYTQTDGNDPTKLADGTTAYRAIDYAETDEEAQAKLGYRVTNAYRDRLFQDLARLAKNVVKLRHETQSWIADIQKDIDHMETKVEEMQQRISDGQDKIKELKVNLIRAEEKYEEDAANLKNTLLQP